MPERPEEYIGQIRYTGEAVADGLLDARKAAQALNGFDGALRFLVCLQDQGLSQADFEIPVRLRKGSWEALIPEAIGKWILLAVGTVATTYGAAAAKRMAENDFREIGIRDVVKNSLRALQWIVRIGKHLGSIGIRTFGNITWRNSNTEAGIANEGGDLLFVPVDILKLYGACPIDILSSMAALVDEDRELRVGVYEDDGLEEVVVTQDEKHIFCRGAEEGEVLFPELAHGQEVELDGLVTRGNERANSIGFLFSDHVLTCYPREGKIVRFKSALFLKCRIVGTVSRTDASGRPEDPRPKIIFDTVFPTEIGSSQPTLF